MSNQAQRHYEFDKFLLDAQQRLLFRDGQPLDLTPKVFDILLELVQSRGRVVQKKELMEKVWPDSYVEESNLTQHISTLRKKLAQPADRERYIMTVPGQGYRFLPSVREWDDEALVTVHERIRARVIIREDVSEPADFENQQLLDDGETLAVAQRPRAEVIHTQSHRMLSPLAQKRRRALQPILVGLPIIAVAIALAFVVYKFFPRERAAPFAETKLVKFTNTGKAVSAAISPDGKYVAYALVDAGRESLWVRQVATSNNGVQVVPPNDFHYAGMTWIPDGNYLYYVGAGENLPGVLYRVPALGGTPSRLLDDVDSPPAFSPDGKQMAYVRGYTDETSLLIANADGSAERKVTSLKGWLDKYIINAGPSWSPDGKRIAFTINTADPEGEYQQLFATQVEDGSIAPVTSQRWLQVGRVAWLKDGRGLMLLAADQESAISQVWYISYPEGTARKVTNDLDDYTDLSLTADSQAMAVVQSNQQANIWVAPEGDASRAIQITNNNYDGVQGMAWTPDGRIIYATLTGPTQNLWITDVDGSRQKQLSDNVDFNRAVAVSPDGRYIVFVSTHDGKQHLWRVDADGSHMQRLTDGIRDNFPVVSPDSQWVVYKSNSLGNANIFKVPIGGGQPIRLTEKISGPPAVSPDGKLIACGYRETQNSRALAIIPFAGGPPVQRLELPAVSGYLFYQWLNDGQGLAYVSTKGGDSNIWVQPLNGGKPAQLTHFDSQRIFRFALSPDGHQLAVARGQVANDVVLIKANK